MITHSVLADSASRISCMTFNQRLPLIEHLYDEQPVLVSFIVSLDEVGAEIDQIGSLLDLLLTFSEAARVAGSTWRVVTDEALRQCVQHCLDRFDMRAVASLSCAEMAVKSAIPTHMEPWVLAHVHDATKGWGWLDSTNALHRHLLFAALVLVECLTDVH